MGKKLPDHPRICQVEFTKDYYCTHVVQCSCWGLKKEEGTGVASDVVKVQGEDPDTSGYLRGDRVRLERRQSRIVGASPLARSRLSPGTVHNDSLISL